MKNTITITLDDAKISALKMYLDMKKTSLDEQLSNFAEQLYGKVVPKKPCTPAIASGTVPEIIFRMPFKFQMLTISFHIKLPRLLKP